MKPVQSADHRTLVTSSDLINILGVVYVHKKLADGGDMYLTRYGLSCGELLDIENWYEKEWFESHRERLIGTSAVYRVPTKTVSGQALNLVVKYSRVGEDVPVNTQVLYEFINAEFNSPWEEFSLTMEMRDGAFGPRNIGIRTQRPLAIYVPPEQMQLWQTGRSRHRINKIIQRHSGVSLDILRQYILVYEWIEGLSMVEAFESLGCAGGELDDLLKPVTLKAIADMEAKGYVVADMKPNHIIVGEDRLRAMRSLAPASDGRDRQIGFLQECAQRNEYSVIDYELLLRTPPHDKQVRQSRRHSYLDDQRNRFQSAPLPSFLKQVEIFGVPYVHGHAESTGGLLWVIGRNPRLFDYFLPERWRRTPCRSLSSRNEVFYTLTKDAINIVWKTSRVGEMPPADEDPDRLALIREHGFNSPFEVCAIAHDLSASGVPTVYVRAIYMTGSEKIEPVTDPRRYESHRDLIGLDGSPVLRADRNYVTIRGYFNGTDSWVSSHEGQLCQPVDLRKAAEENLIPREQCLRLLDATRARLRNLHYDGSLLELNDLLISIEPHGHIVRDAEGLPEARICNFELVYKS
jgi:hypothetical protein